MFWKLLVAGGALTAAAVASSTGLAAEIRGSLQAIESLHPAPPPDVTGRRLFYWEEPNSAIDVRHPHANPEFDLALILTGDGVAEMTRPVPLAVIGGRCRPGTIVVAPNGVITVQNQDWFPHQFFAAVPSAPTTPIAAFPPDETAPRSERQVQIAEAGTYELHDRLQPLFRCWIVVGSGQGKIFTPAADGSFHLGPLPDGNYTFNVLYQGRSLAQQTAAIAHEHDVTLPPINLAAPPPATPPAGSAPPASGGAPGAQPPAGGAAQAAGSNANAAPAEDHEHHHHHHGGH